MFTITKAQLHVSAINVGHLQVHEELINKLYQRVWGSLQFVEWGGCEISFCVGDRDVDWGCFGNCVNVTSMSTYSYV